MNRELLHKTDCRIGVLRPKLWGQGLDYNFHPATDQRRWRLVTYISGIIFNNALQPNPKKPAEQSLLLTIYRDETQLALGGAEGWRYANNERRDPTDVVIRESSLMSYAYEQQLPHSQVLSSLANSVKIDEVLWRVKELQSQDMGSGIPDQLISPNFREFEPRHE